MTAASAKTVPAGLAVERHPTAGRGYVVIREASGKDAGPWLRLRRQAEACAAELGETGADWTLGADELRATPAFRTSGPVGVVVTRWKKRAYLCCEGNEHYSVLTYAM